MLIFLTLREFKYTVHKTAALNQERKGREGNWKQDVCLLQKQKQLGKHDTESEYISTEKFNELDWKLKYSKPILLY